MDTDGQAFADAALSEREDNRQLGANNFWLAPHFIKRLGHLGWRRARVHYKCAGAAYPGYWLVDEHIAELLGADGEYREAAAILERILSIADRADLRQAIGELYELAAEPAMARRWYDSALTGYLQTEVGADAVHPPQYLRARREHWPAAALVRR